MLELICVAVFVCDYVFHWLQLLFALNLPVFTMILCLYICWNVCNIYFLSVLAIWNKLNSMDNMFEIVKVAIINSLDGFEWIMWLHVVEGKTPFSSAVTFFSSLFGFSQHYCKLYKPHSMLPPQHQMVDNVSSLCVTQKNIQQLNSQLHLGLPDPTTATLRTSM